MSTERSGNLDESITEVRKMLYALAAKLKAIAEN
jgi:hypothetical protein